MPKKLAPVLLLMTSLAACGQSGNKFWPPGKSPDRIAGLVTEDLLSRKDFMMYRTETVKGVHYAEVCAAFGAARVAGALGDSSTLHRLSQRYMKVIDEGILNTANHVDVNVYGILPLELYRQTGNRVFYKQGMDLADSQWEDPGPDGLTRQARFWIDDVWMIGSLQAEAYRVTGNITYLDRAATMAREYLEKLQRPNGLFYHGENAPFFWGRGNGWTAAGLAEILSELPEDHPLYGEILEGYRTMMNSLLMYQAADGMWRQLVDVESAWKETSCTAMFAYAMAMGVKRGILPVKSFTPAFRKAWLALADYINGEGKISEVCVGTGQSTDMKFYLNRPRVTGDFHGQAPVLWLAWCLLSE